MPARTMHWLAAVLLLIGLARLAQVAVHSPMLGYANNYDFIKMSSTVGVWPDEPGVERTAGHAEAPLSHYRSHGERRPDLRYISSELIFVYPAIGLANTLNLIRGAPLRTFDLRILGVVKTLFFFAAGAFLTILFFRRWPWLGVIASFIFATVICDPLNSLYLNTFYFECSAVLFTYIALGLGLHSALKAVQSRILLTAFCLSLLLLGFSKMQHIGLPLAIALAYCAAQAGRSWKAGGARSALKACLPPLLTALLTLGLGAANNGLTSMRGMVAGAATDSWFGAVLPALKDPPAALRALGVPERCDSFVGKNWYAPGMQPPPCPEIFELTHFQKVWLLLKEPSAAWRILTQAIPATRPFIVFYGKVEGRNFGHIQDEGLRFASLGKLVGELPLPVYILLLIVSGAGGMLSLFLLIRGSTELAATFSVFLNAVLAYTLTACVLGGGYFDLSRHFHIAQNALLLSPLVSLLVAGRQVRRVIASFGTRWSSRARGERAIGVRTEQSDRSAVP